MKSERSDVHALEPTRDPNLALAAGVLAALLALALPASAVQEGPGAAPANAEEAPPTLAEKTAGLEQRAGLLDLWIDRDRGRVFLSVPPPADSSGTAIALLYVEGLVTGLGSNPVGLDRGQIGPTRVLELRHAGGRVLAVVPNLAFRASSDDASERRAAAESFATSVLWGGEVAARDPDGRVLVDFTSFAVRDAHAAAGRLKAAGQGTWKLDPDRSALLTDACLAFPENLELEALLTFAGDEPGAEVRRTAPVPDSVSLVQHHSFVKLPDDGYQPRPADPRTGHFALSYQDYAAPLAGELEVRLAVRHRLERTDPAAESSPVVRPIVYYLDPATPEPVRSALLDGARWWTAAFEAAGFEDAFQVEMLPEGAHPLDVRYHVIQWVHRATRGWSYGGGVRDPRTGEMIKGHVSLGSLRVRQDRLLFEGLAGAARTGTGAPDDPIELSLARLRQLAAHEVGHTLGLAHNFAASTQGRASVMDYPAPLVQEAGGELDFSAAYAVGVGDWDRHAIRWLYAEFPEGADEAAELDGIARDGIARGLVYLSDPDARPASASDPRASLWDNGADPVAELASVMRVRRVALTGFGARNLAPGRPLADLRAVFTPVYLHHRYQVAAAAKVLGGVEYDHALSGDGQLPARPVSATRQRDALLALLAALGPAELDVPEEALALLVPALPQSGPNRELLRGGTAPVFDALAAAATAADLVITALFEPQRAKRLVDQHRRDEPLPGLSEVLDLTFRATFFPRNSDSLRLAALRREVQSVLIGRLLELAADPASAHAVRAEIEQALAALYPRLSLSGSIEERAHRSQLSADIQRFLNREEAVPRARTSAPDAPPGDPIGAASLLDGCRCGFGPFD